MAPRGQKPKPEAIKKAQGTARKDRVREQGADFKQIEGTPAAPAWLKGEEALAEWKRLAQILTQTRTLTVADVSMLALLCAQFGDVVRKYENKGEPTAAELSQLRMYYSEFGLTPASRTRVGIAAGGNAPPSNPFSAHGKRP